MGELTCADAYAALSDIKAALSDIEEGNGPIDVDEDIVAFLRTNEYVEALPTWAVFEFRQDKEGLPELYKKLEETRNLRDSHYLEYSLLQRESNMLDNRPLVGVKAISNYRGYMDEEKKKYETQRDKAASLEQKIANLEEIPDFEDFIPTHDGEHVKLLPAGNQLLTHLEARLERVGNLTLRELEQDIARTQERIDTICDRYLEYRVHLAQGNWKVKSDHTNDYAFHMALLEEKFDDVISPRCPVVNNHLNDNGWSGRHRCYVVVTTAALDGAITRRKDELVETYLLLHREHNFGKNIYSWWESSRVMHLGGTVRSNVARFMSVLDEMTSDSNYSAKKCFIAANLSQDKGTPEELVQSHYELKAKLVTRGRRDCFDADVAALILRDAEGSFDERADRFNEAFLAMNEQNWERNTEFYPAAAVLTLLPGTFEENIEWYSYILEKTDDKGLAYPRSSRAASVLLSVYGVETTVTPFVIPTHEDF